MIMRPLAWMREFSSVCLLISAALVASSATAQNSVIAEYATSKWEGGAVDNDEDGNADFCLMFPRSPLDQVMLLLQSMDGFMIGLINPLWQIDELDQLVDLQVVIPGHWKGVLDAKVTEPDTLVVPFGGDGELMEAFKSGGQLNAYFYIGDFSVSLSGSRDAVAKINQCYEEAVWPNMSQAAPTVTETAPIASFADGQTAYDNEDYFRALEIWQQLAMDGDRDAMNSVGRLFQVGQGVEQDHEAAIYWFTQAAEMGLDTAQYNLARHYDKGWGVPVDHALAVEWYSKSAAQGYDRAQLAMGIKLVKGEGIDTNLQAAREWYLLAAQNGNRAAQFNLGTMLRKGQGGEANPVEAVYWYRRSASQGYAWAQLRLADALAQGNGTSKDTVAAYAWYVLAAENGKDQAKSAISVLGSVLSEEEKVRAADLVANWQEARETPSNSTVVQPLTIGEQPPIPVDPQPLERKRLPDDLFARPDASSLPATSALSTPRPEAAPAPSATHAMRVEGCYDRSDAKAVCLATCSSPEFSQEMSDKKIVRLQSAAIAVQYCEKGCAQAQQDFDDALDVVAPLKGTKFFCPMLYVEAEELARQNQIPREHGDRSALNSHKAGANAYLDATRLEATPEQLAALSRVPYPPHVQAMLNEMPMQLERCYSLEGTEAMDYCKARCIEMSETPNTGLTSDQHLELCQTGCEMGPAFFREQYIWTKGLTYRNGFGNICDALSSTKLAILEIIRNASLLDGLSSTEESAMKGGVIYFWRGVGVAGGR